MSLYESKIQREQTKIKVSSEMLQIIILIDVAESRIAFILEIYCIPMEENGK